MIEETVPFPNQQSAISNQQSQGWVWHDPFGDCSLTLEDGVTIRAANGRGLSHPNRSAPRLLRSISGDFVLQTRCRVASDAMPAVGGLLLWKDRQQYLRLDWGVRGAHQVAFGGCLPGSGTPARLWPGEKERIFGRGRLVAEGAPRDAWSHLRLERRGGVVRALASADGRVWFRVGQTEFSDDGAVEVGLYASGLIDRMVYHGAHTTGTAIHFDTLELSNLRMT